MPFGKYGKLFPKIRLFTATKSLTKGQFGSYTYRRIKGTPREVVVVVSKAGSRYRDAVNEPSFPAGNFLFRKY